MTRQILLAGFGGQGILFAGKFLAYKGLVEGKHLSWLPSYGPEMRGGTANCSVILSDEPVGSPIVTRPDALIAMNLPSLDKYENAVVPGGTLFYDSSLIERSVARTDIRVISVPATRIAGELGTPTLANMVIIGRYLAEYGENEPERIREALSKVVSAKHADLLEVNLKAMEAGAALR